MRNVTRALLTVCMLVWVLPSLSAVGHVTLGDSGACDDPFCACPVPEDGGRCDCPCCSPHERHDSAIPEICGECGPGDLEAGVVSLVQFVPAPAVALPVPDGSTAMVLSSSDVPLPSPSSIPEPVPRARV